MVEFNLLEKLNIIFDFIKKNSLISLVILLIIVMLLDLFYGKNKKSTKITYSIIICLSLIYIFMIYYKPLFNIIDVYITNIVKLTYFPSIIDYISFVFVSVFIQIFSYKKGSNVIKNINLWCGIFIEILFIINVIAMNNIVVDLNSVTSIYQNDLLLSIFQITGLVFVIWLLFNIMYLIVHIFVNNRIEMPKLNEYYE
ncbi:MAG: hypothetical protein IJD92_03205 [Bacilli bacterium]|nr:hypothetical protein [Bacilli bacterium]